MKDLRKRWGTALLLCLAVTLSGCASSRRIQSPLPAVCPVKSPNFAHAAGALLGANFLAGNRIDTLNDGDEIFPAMLKAIRSARRTITFETFIFRPGKVAHEFQDALAERARAGVKVSIIVDALGSIGSRSYFAALRAAGARVEIYHPIWSADVWRLNYRTHRKLLVIDGKVGFIGGVGIGDEWINTPGKKKEAWHELHYRLEGPVVADMQAVFHSNWFKLHHEVILGPGYFPNLTAAGTTRAGVFFSSPQRGRYAVGLMYHLAIAGAKETLYIENPYFVPDQALTDALCAAARRGVKIQVIMPGAHIDFSLVRAASQRRWGRLLAAGIQLYEYKGVMLHSKLLIADGIFVSVGSANFDPRSLAINDESNLNVLDRSFAKEQTAIFQRDLLHSRPVKRAPSSELFDIPLDWVQTLVEPQL